jgi:hypothetical protein
MIRLKCPECGADFISRTSGDRPMKLIEAKLQNHLFMKHGYTAPDAWAKVRLRDDEGDEVLKQP